MKSVFFGTPQFAATILDKLVSSNLQPDLVVCAPDKPVGRRQIVTPPAVKVVALENNIPVLQPDDLSGEIFLGAISDLSPDFGVVAAYGKILPRELIKIPTRGMLNVHPSLLSRWRGASPIQYALLHGDERTGISIMLIDEKMDHGPILAQEDCEIEHIDTYDILSERLSHIGADLLIKIIPPWIKGDIIPKIQNHEQATFTKIIKKEDGRIDWGMDAVTIERKTRAFYPWPGTFSWWEKGDKREMIKIHCAKISNTPIAPVRRKGEVFLSQDGNLMIQCGEGALMPITIQASGGKSLKTKDFLRGHEKIVGAVLE